MFRRSRIAVLMVLGVTLTATTGRLSAAPVSTALSAPATGLETGPFTVSSMDIGQTLGTWTLLSGTADFSSVITELNDGNKYGGQTVGFTNHSFTPSNGAVGQLTFSTPVDITSIVSLTGTGQSRAGQVYTVQYSTDGAIFQLLDTVGGEPNNNDGGTIETQVTIADPLNIPIAINVKALRFTFQNSGAPTVDQSMYREIDVFGSAAVPEAGDLAIWSCVGLLALAYAARYRRQRA